MLTFRQCSKALFNVVIVFLECRVSKNNFPIDDVIIKCGKIRCTTHTTVRWWDK